MIFDKAMTALHGIGTDIVQIDRIREALERFGERFARRVLTEAEFSEFQGHRRPERFLAKRFAAKEATVKALGLGFRKGLAANLIGVSHDAHGKPGLFYLGSALEQVQAMGITDSLISLSDERDYALALVILLREK